MAAFSSLSVNICCMVVVLLSVFPWFVFLMKVFRYICKVVCDLCSGGTILGLYFPFNFLNFSHTLLVGVLEFSEFTNLFHVSFLAFLKTLSLMTLLHWNVLNLVTFVGVFYILLSFLSLPFHILCSIMLPLVFCLSLVMF